MALVHMFDRLTNFPNSFTDILHRQLITTQSISGKDINQSWVPWLGWLKVQWWLSMFTIKVVVNMDPMTA